MKQVGVLFLHHLQKWICSLLHGKFSFLDDSNLLHCVMPWGQVSFVAVSEWKELGIPPIIVKWKTLRSLKAICSSRVLRLWDLSTVLQVKALQTKPCIYSKSPPPSVGIPVQKCHARTQLCCEMLLFSSVQGMVVMVIHSTQNPGAQVEDEDCAWDQASVLRKNKERKSTPKGVWDSALSGLWF